MKAFRMTGHGRAPARPWPPTLLRLLGAALAAIVLLALFTGRAHAQALPVTSGLRLHLKADLGVTASGGTVSAWADQSGNGFHVEQATATMRPAFTANAANGKPALTLDGTDDFLQSNASVDLLGAQTSYSYFIVAKPATTQKAYADLFDYSHNSSVRFVVQQDAGQTNKFYNNGYATQQLYPTAFNLLTGTHVNGGTVMSRANGVNELTATSSTNSFGTPSAFRVGNWINSGREFTGQIAEVVMYNRVLTASEITQVETYLDTKYNLGINGPAFMARPMRAQSARFWFDSGAKTTMTAADGAFDDALETAVANGASGLSVGAHSLSIEMQAVDGTWGSAFTSALTVVSPMATRTIRIQSGEVDLNGTVQAVAALDGAFDDAVESVVNNRVVGLSAGAYSLRIRLRGQDGQFGPWFSSALTVVAPMATRNIRIQSGEVQLGVAAAVPVVAIDGSFNDAIESVVRNALAAGATAGPQVLRVRLQGQDGQFGPWFSSVLTVVAPMATRTLRITAGEVQLGAAAAVPVVAIDGAFDEVVESVVRNAISAGATAGPQLLRVRLQGQDGQFGPWFSSVLTVVAPMPTRLVRIQEGRVWWNADLANAVPLAVINGSLNAAVATATGVLPTGSLLPGAQALRVQLKGEDGQWGNTFTTAVVIQACTPLATPVASSGQYIYYQGQTLQLNSTTVSGATYEWRGPNGFTSTTQNPQIVNATLAAGGTYWVRTIGPAPDRCPSPEDSVNVRVLPLVTITTDAVLPTSICAGSSFNVGYDVTSGTLLSGNQLRVQLSDNAGDFTAATIIGGPVTSTAASGSIPVTIPAGVTPGTQYRIRVIASSPATNGANNGAALTISTPFSVTANSNSPIFAGSTLNLSVASAPSGATFAWTGPNGFTSAIATPQIINATTAATGTYQVVVTRGACTSTSTVAVTVNTSGTVTIGTINPTSYCAGTAISVPYTISGTFTGGNVFTAQLSNASGSFASPITLGALSSTAAGTINGTVPAGTPAGTGYRIRILSTAPVSTSAVNSTDLAITDVTATVASSNSPVALGATITLSVTGAPVGSTFAWTGPGTIQNAGTANASVLNAQPSNIGTYQVLVSKDGCSVTRSVTVDFTTAIYTDAIAGGTAFCAGGEVTVNFRSTGAYVSPAPFVAGNTFYARVVDPANGNVLGTIGTLNQGGSIFNRSISGTWPAGIGAGPFRVRVDSDQPGITGTTTTANITLTDVVSTVIGSNSPVAAGGTITLTATGAPAGSTYAWTGPGTILNATTATASVTNAQVANSGTYQVIVTRNGCSTTKTVSVTVNPSASVITTGTISPTTYCAGGTVSVPFTVSGGAFNTGNVFTAQLLDSLGSVLGTIGTVSGTTGSTITGTIPASAPYSLRDRIRVIGSNPATTGSVNAQDLTIIQLGGATAVSNSPVANGGTVQLNVTGVPAASLNSYVWSKISGGGTFSSTLRNPTISGATTANSGTYQVVVSRGGCSVTRTVSVTVQPPVVTNTVTTTGPASGTYCAGSPIYVDFTTTGTFAANNVFTAQLSDANGSFASPVTIGTANGPGAGSGQIGGPIPVGTPAGTGYLVRILSSNPNLIGTTSGPLTVSATAFTWVGGADSNWNNPANWSCGVVPGQNDDVTINPGGNSPVVGVGGGVVRSITINLNTTLTVNATFTVWGNVVNHGTIGAGSGSGWVWAGTGGSWTVSGSGVYNFWNVTVNNTVNLTINQNINVRGNIANGGTLTQPWNYYLYYYGPGTISGNPSTWGTFYVPTGGSVNWNTGITAWGIYNGGSLNPGTSGFTFGAGGGGAGSMGGPGSNAIPFYDVTFNNPAGVNQLSDVELFHFWTNNYTFNPGTRRVTFTGPGTVINGPNVVFYDIVINATANVTLNVDIIIRGDLINDGSFNCGTRRVTFDGTTQLIGGSVVTNFFDITFNNTVNLTLNQNIIVDGDWLNTGTFSGVGYYVLFSGTGAQTVGGAGSTRFGTVRWNNAAGVSLTSPIRVAGDFAYLGGGWNAGGFPVTFDGTAGQNILGPSNPVFAGLVNNNTSVGGLALATNIRATGNLSGTGRFCGCGFETWLSGGTQTISGPGRWDFHHIRINATVNVTLNTDIYVYGNWFCDGPFNPNGFTVYFDGTISQLIHGPAITNFYHLVINNTLNVTLNQTIRVRGNFGGPGVLLGDGWFTIFDGTAAQTVNTGAGTRFGHVTFANGTGVSLGSNIGLTGNFLNTAGFIGTGRTVGFYGTGTQTVNGAGIVFGNAYTAPGATASLGVPVSFGGNLTNDGAWLANTHACTFTGAACVIGGANAPLFYHLYIELNAQVTLAVNIHLTGDLRHHGTFVPGTRRCTFGGTLPQRIYGTATVFNFYDITVNTNAVVNVETDIHCWHDLLNNGTINWPTCRVVYFDGTTLQTIGGTTVTRFCGITVNNPGGTVTLGQNIRCSGDFRDNGGWRGNGYTTTFDGGGAQGIYGQAGGGTSFGGLTFNNGSGAGATLFGPIALTGDFRNTAGFNAGGFGVTFGGNGTQNVYGPSQVVFHHLIIDVAATLQLNLDIRLTGNWTNRNIFLPNGWRVWFIGTVAQLINGPAVTNFFHITINNTVSVSLSHDIRIRGNFIDNGVFCGCGHLTTFDGTAPQTITCNSGNTRFHDITFANPTGVTLLGAIGVTGNWVNNGGFNAGGQLVLFAGTGAQTIGGSALTTFHGWRNTNNSAAGVSLIRDAAWTGDWTNDGRYCGCGFTSSFVGTTPQTITCNTLQSAFHHITLSNTSTGGVRLGGDIGVTGNWHVTGLFFPVTYTVHFTGTAGQTITRGGLMLHCQFYGIRIVNNTTAGVSLGTNCPLYVSGPFTNNGTFGLNGNGIWANGGTGGNGSGGNGAGGHLGGGGAAGGGGGNGAGGQAFGGSSPTTFGNWTMQNPGGATCAGPGGFGVQQVLTMAPNCGNLACGNAVTLLSNATGTGMIVNTPTGGVCTGLGTMVRFVNSGATAPGYRHYSSPMRAGTATVNEFADDLPVFNLNPAFNSATNPNAVTPFPTLFQYDDSRIPSTAQVFDRGWMVPASASAPMISGKGYSAQTNANTVVDITGTFQTGNVTTPTLTRGAYTASGWNLVGNPYPAPMDWRLVTKPGTVNNALYIHKPTGRYTGTFASWVNGVAQNGGDPVLSAMQGFFVRVNAPGSTTLTFTDAARLTTWTNPTFWRPAATVAETRPLIRLVVTAPVSGKADETVLYFEQGATRAFDRDYDAGKPLLSGGGYPTVWSVNGTESFAINGLPEADLTNGNVIPLAVRVPADGQYVLSARQLLNLPAGAPVWLEDRQLGTVRNLAIDSVYAFSMLAANTTPRFFLNVGRGMPTGTSAALDLAAARLGVYPNPASADLTVRLEGLPNGIGTLTATLVDALGRDLLTTTLRPELGTAEQTLDVRELPQGVYTLRLKPAANTGFAGWARKVVLSR